MDSTTGGMREALQCDQKLRRHVHTCWSREAARCVPDRARAGCVENSHLLFGFGSKLKLQNNLKIVFERKKIYVLFIAQADCLRSFHLNFSFQLLIF